MCIYQQIIILLCIPSVIKLNPTLPDVKTNSYST